MSTERGEGMGFQQLEMINKAMLSILVWRLVKYPEELSYQVLAGKYGRWSKLVKREKITRASHICSRAIGKVFTLVYEGIRWKLGNGEISLFWLDKWWDVIRSQVYENFRYHHKWFQEW